VTKKSYMLVVAADSTELDQVELALPEWRCVHLTVSGDGVVPPTQENPPAFAIVFAQAEESVTLSICREVRAIFAKPEPVLILLAVNRYSVEQGSAVRDLGRASFVLLPLKRDLIRSKVDEILKSPPE
jgi:hypothetical protein